MLRKTEKSVGKRVDNSRDRYILGIYWRMPQVTISGSQSPVHHPRHIRLSAAYPFVCPGHTAQRTHSR